MSRIKYIDIAKAICIILVVIGHYCPLSAPAYWKQFVDFIIPFICRYLCLLVATFTLLVLIIRSGILNSFEKNPQISYPIFIRLDYHYNDKNHCRTICHCRSSM